MYVDVETKVRLSSFLLTPSQPQSWDFLGGPMVKTSPSSSGGGGSIPGQPYSASFLDFTLFERLKKVPSSIYAKYLHNFE